MILTGDCLEVMPTLEAESVDAVVTDPPYGINFMGKEWDGPAIARPGRTTARSSSAFGSAAHYAGPVRGGQPWQDWCYRWATEAFRLAKPSAYLLAFGGTRTVHRMTCAIEDAGWIVRDMLVWAYASGFPKSKASLKPAWEPIVMARKPGPLRELAIDATRIGFASEADMRSAEALDELRAKGLRENIIGRGQGVSIAPVDGRTGHEPTSVSPLGRWPANVILTETPDGGGIFDGGWDGVVGGGADMSHPAVMRNDANPGGFLGDTVRRAGTQLGYPDEPPGTYSRFFLLPRSAMPSGTIGTCERCGAPTAGSSASSDIPASAVGSAPSPASEPVVSSVASSGPPVSGVVSPLRSPETATAPRRAPTPPDGTPGSTASAADQATGSDTNGTATSTLPEQEPGTASPSDQPARTAEPPGTSTGTTTTTPSPSLCERCADDATHGRTLPQPRRTRPALPVDGDDYTRFLIIPKADRAEREPIWEAAQGEPTVRNITEGHGRGPVNTSKGDGTGIRENRPRLTTHPTVKPVELMRHLVRLVTPTGGLVLDPFLGSGTTAIAAEMEGFRWIGIEREPEYVAQAEARLHGTQRGMGLPA